jgi:hypothetical protein
MAGALSGRFDAWECRRFWRKGAITGTEWWHNGTRAPQTPTVGAARRARTTDYCAMHYTHIYPDLPCPYCQERPDPAQ